jgi:uncharacterized RDD family membrane protein YckC
MINKTQMLTKPLASITKRAFANIIDYFIFFLFFMVYNIFFGELSDKGYQLNVLMFIPVVFLWFLFFVVVEGIWQASVGHQLLNIKVCQENFETINIRHSFKRRILDILDFSLIGIPAIILVNTNNKKKRLGDMFAKTIVVDS